MKRLVPFAFLMLFVLFVAMGARAQISGTKTIGGTSPNYLTVKAAVQALNAQGVASPGVTFLIRGGTYTEDSLMIRTSTTSASARITFKPDAGATVVVNVTPASASLPFAIKIDSTNYVTIDGSNNGTTSRDLTINAIGTNGEKGVWLSGGCYYTTMKNCIVRAGSASSAAYRSIDVLFASVPGGNASNSVIENNLCRNSYTGIRAEGYSATDALNDLIIRNNVVDSIANAGIYTLTQIRTQIQGNDVSLLIGSTATMYGIYVGLLSTNVRVYNNRVHDLKELDMISFVYGIYLSSQSPQGMNCVFNNFIWNFNATDAGSNWFYGIGVTYSNVSVPDTIAYNSVYLAGTSSGNKLTYGFNKVSVQGQVYVVNNTFHVTRTDGTTGFSAAMARASTATLYANNNNLYVGIPDARHVTGRIGATNYVTLADWRAANASDANSIGENSPFVSATDLHLQTTVPTQLESGAIPLAGIATDIDGNPRNATTPDIGGDEGTFLPVDLAGPIISYTPLPNTSSTTNRTLTATITDVSGVPTSGTGLPRLYWKINNGSYSAAIATSLGGGQYSFSFGAGVAMGDSVSYYVCAQDNAPTLNVGAMPSVGASGFTANPPAASIPPTNPYKYKITLLPLAAGDYTIGTSVFERITGRKLTQQLFTRKVLKEAPVEVPPSTTMEKKPLAAPASASFTPSTRTELREVEEAYTLLMENGKPYAGPDRVDLAAAQKAQLGLPSEVLANYTTITAAIADLNSRGVAGAVRFLLVDTAYTSETYPIIVNVVSESRPTASNTVTLKPYMATTARVRGNLSGGAIFRIINTNYFTIDGSNTTGGTTRNLTFENTHTTGPQVLIVGSTGTTPITNVTLKNCVIINGTTGATPILVSDGATPGSPGYFSDVTVENNSIRKAYMGMYITGGVSPQHGFNLTVRSNDIVSTATDSIRYIGVYLQGVSGATIADNNIGSFSPTIDEVDRGIWLATGTVNSVVERNTVHDLYYSGTNGFASQGIAVSSTLANCNNTVRNNMVYNIRGDGDSYASFGAQYSPVGIFAWGAAQSGVSIYYNTIHLYGSSINKPAVYSIGIALDDGVSATVKNNLIVNKLGLMSTTGVGAVGIAVQISAAQFTAIDHNDYYCNAAFPAMNIVGKIGAIDYTTLTEWASVSGGDTHSLSTDVTFVAQTNLHISTSVPSALDSAGSPIAGITTDFEGDARNATRPDIGADEFSIITGVETQPEVPTAFALEQNYPNPFNPTTTIRYSIPVGTYGHTSLQIYDILGREVATLVNEVKARGRYSVRWNATGIASGVYFYRMTTVSGSSHSFVETKKFVLLK